MPNNQQDEVVDLMPAVLENNTYEGGSIISVGLNDLLPQPPVGFYWKMLEGQETLTPTNPPTVKWYLDNVTENSSLTEGTIKVIRDGEILPFAPSGFRWIQIIGNQTHPPFTKWILERHQLGQTRRIRRPAHRRITRDYTGRLRIDSDTGTQSPENRQDSTVTNPHAWQTVVTSGFVGQIASLSQSIQSVLRSNFPSLPSFSSTASSDEPEDPKLASRSNLESDVSELLSMISQWESSVEKMGTDDISIPTNIKKIESSVKKMLDGFKTIHEDLFRKEKSRQERISELIKKRKERKIMMVNRRKKSSWFVAPIGMEYTYHLPYAKNFSHPILQSNPKVVSNFKSDLLEIAENFGRPIGELRVAEDQGPVLEISSKVHRSFSDMMWWYNKIEFLAKKYNLKPFKYGKGGGGGHVNMSLPEGDEKFKQIFIYNIIVELANRPYLCWIFNEPSDNHTAECVYEDYTVRSVNEETSFEDLTEAGGKAYSFRMEADHYFELRFFEAYRNKTDLLDVIKFVNAWVGSMEKMAREGVYVKKDPRIWGDVSEDKADESDIETLDDEDGDADTQKLDMSSDSGKQFKKITSEILGIYSEMTVVTKNENTRKARANKVLKIKLDKLNNILNKLSYDATEEENSESPNKYMKFVPIAKDEFNKMLVGLNLDPKNYTRFIKRNFEKRIKFPYGTEYLT